MKSRLNDIARRIAQAANACLRKPEDIRLVAVSKTVPPDRIRQAIEAGATTFGENYIQEAREKIQALADLQVSWHFIGHLQSNKAKYAVKLFDMIHSVDSIKLAREIDKQAAKIGKIQPILIQVNISEELTKSGTAPENTFELVTEANRLEHVSVKGLMTMPPFFDDPERARPYFRALFDLRRRIRDVLHSEIALPELSMGMTGDFEAAIAEGATMVRIGTAIFGKRA